MIAFRHILLFILLCKTIAGAFSQDYSIKNYSVEEGLPHSRVVVLNEDSKGYLWVGTYGGGVSRFDGRKFESFDESNGLVSSVVMGIEVDSKDNVWICTPLGISKFDGTSFRNFSGHFERGFFGMDVYEHRDTIFTLIRAANDWRFGIIFQDSIIGTNFRFGQSEHITNAFAADNSTLYLNLANGDVLRKTDQFTKIADSLIVIRFFKSKWGVHALTTTGVFDLTDNGEVLRIDGLEVDWITIDNNFTHAWVWKNGSLRKISFSGSRWKDENFQLPFESAYSMIDSEGNSWFGTIGKGLFRFSETDFVKLNNTGKSVYAFVKDEKSNVWVGSGNGIEIFDSRNRFIKQIDFGDRDRNRINSLALDSNKTIWAGTMGGLCKIQDDGKKIQWFTTNNGLNDNRIRSLEIDSEGRLWIAYMSGRGLSIFDGHENEKITAKNGLLVESVWDLRYSKANQTMFVCTDSGVQKFKNDKFESIRIPEFKNKILLSLGIYKDRFLLVGSGGSGLAVVDSSGAYTILTTKDGLSSNFIYLSEADSTNSIWIGTVKGIDKFSLDANLKITSLKHFGSQNGLSPNGVNTNAYLVQGASRFFGMTEGAYSYQELKESDESKFPLHFVQIHVNNKFIEISKDSVFASYENQLEFIFNKVNKSGLVIRYQYMIEHWDDGWINSTEGNRANYSKLLPGNYIVRVRAANSEGVWSDEIKYAFEILSPIYQRAWFKILAVLFIAGCVSAFIYFRTKIRINQIILVAKARNEESLKIRKEIGRDFHDEVGNQLARLINYIGLLKMPGISERSGILNKMEETSKYLLTGTKDFIWSIDPVHDNLDSLSVHIRDFGEKLLEEKHIEFRFHSDISAGTKLPPGYTRQINLIFKEALTNVFKHSEAKCVKLEVHQNVNLIRISLVDNGIGLSKHSLESSDGLKNMRFRAHKVNGSLEIFETIGGGLTVELLFKL